MLVCRKFLFVALSDSVEPLFDEVVVDFVLSGDSVVRGTVDIFAGEEVEVGLVNADCFVGTEVVAVVAIFVVVVFAGVVDVVVVGQGVDGGGVGHFGVLGCDTGGQVTFGQVQDDRAEI